MIGKVIKTKSPKKIQIPKALYNDNNLFVSLIYFPWFLTQYIFHNSEGVGFLPGHASLAYFFLFGSSGSSNWGTSILDAFCKFDAAPMAIPPIWAGTLGGVGAMSISGAGLGNGIPSFDDNEDAKRDGPLL